MAIIISGYQINETINKGEKTTIYRGIREIDKQPVILKVLKEAYPPPLRIAWFKRERNLLKRLKAVEGVINVHDFLIYQNRLVITIEDFEAQSVAELMKLRPLRLSEFFPIAISIVETLGQIHHLQVIHKDINPSNIIYSPKTGQVKLIDFGISTDISREKANLRQEKELRGTLAYISPEQTGRMNRIVDYRTDYYSLGATFYEMLTGQMPFPINDTMALVHAHIAKPPEPLHKIKPGVPEPLSDIVLKLMAKNAEDRYQSTFGIKADLEECWQQWKSSGRINSFPLARLDVTSHFQMPQKLYGREKEIETLLAAFDRVSYLSKSEMMLVAGYSGIGKTVLVQEVHKPMTRQRGYFISGKFDQYQRDIPYVSLTQAFQSLIRQLLAESEEEIAAWKEKLIVALEQNGQVIIDVIPELILIIGPQPQVSELGPKETQNRFNLLFQNFIQVFTKPEHPLIIFLDDLQWADSASLKLLLMLMTTSSHQNLFVMGAYRNNEVSPSHPLLSTLAEIEKEGGVLNTITLAPLSQSVVNQIIADALYSSVENTLALNKLVYTKTAGNPFFFTEFLKALYDKNLLTFDAQQGKWQWDLEKIEAHDMTDNVVVLMADKVQKLPDHTQQVLKLGACIGNQFDLQTLAIVYQKSTYETATHIHSALIEGLVLPLDENYKVVNLDVKGLAEEVTTHYKFAHDRVQQAVYSLIPDKQKQAVHLKVGQLLLKNTPKEGLELKLFDIVNQLNLGRALIEKQSERDELAHLCLRAGEKAKASAAFYLSLRDFKTGIEMVRPKSGTSDEETWQRKYDLMLELHNNAVEASYLSVNFDQMGQLIEVVLKNAHTLLDKVNVYQTMIQAQTAMNKPLEAIEVGLLVLKDFGVTFPENPTDSDVLNGSKKIKAILAEHNFTIKELTQLPPMTDAKQLAILRLLQSIISVSYVAAPQLWGLLLCEMVQRSIKHGNAPTSISGYAAYGLALAGMVYFMDHSPERQAYADDSYDFGKLALELVGVLENAKPYETSASHIFHGCISPWKNPLKETLSPLLKTYEDCELTGDLIFGSWAYYMRSAQLYYIGKELPLLASELAKVTSGIGQYKQRIQQEMVIIMEQAVHDLVEGPPNLNHLMGDYFNEEEKTPVLRETKNLMILCMVYLNNLLLCYLFEDYPHAFERAVEGEKYLTGAIGLTAVPVFYFYASLARLAVYENSSEEQKKELLNKVKELQKNMKFWADNAPVNFQNKLELINAELARVLGQVAEAREYYDTAIQLATESGFLQEEALANELAARFYLNRSQTHVARHYLRDAIYAYTRWGATAKVQQLEKKYPELLAQTAMSSMVNGVTGTTTFSTTTMFTRTEHGYIALDFISILKASQTLSGQIVLDTLLSNLMKIVIENAGAERGFLLFNKQGQWVIEASGEIDVDEIKVLQSIPIQTTDGSEPLLPISIINYVTNSKDSVVLNDAINEGDFIKDNYIVNHKPKSVLCFPLLNQGKLQGILYLENTLSTGAFTPDRIQVLSLLSAQAAISIENAHLYGHQVELTDSYSRFVPMEYLRFLQKERIMDVKLGDHVAKDMAVMFSDIRSFTALSEKMSAQENFDFVNSYLKRVSPQIRDNNGFIVKYLGDGMMAVFPNGADDAVKAALSKLKRVEQYNTERQAENRQPITIGIGIHVGHMMVGMVGEAARIQGDAFSDNVNLTSRLESLTKFYGVSLVISEETLNNLEDSSRYQIRFLDKVIVIGRTEPILVYEILDGETEGVMNLKLETQGYFEKGIRRYQSKNFVDAKSHFDEVLNKNPNDKAATFYVQRIDRLLTSGVPDNWDGVTSLTEK
ncbi:AAA family ATPase [Candidatus Parabeggiatoa sp. HSG14]|uniref:AAA family ATPase n=1 Tax=Candidatus Parabeggiatoa sp. HSG14 TaxID=3055593 RepID=UPI0025A77527|nr:AAA family ATPase [Thiotrichales bacterium HSG14]